MISKDKWVWMPHPGHLCVGFDCRFRLNTRVGKYIISTVGEYFPDSESREVIAESRGIKLKGKGDERIYDFLKQIGFVEIGFDRKYETMVFKAEKDKSNCCPWRMVSGEIDMEGYNDSEAAMKGHMKFCMKWAKKQ